MPDALTIVEPVTSGREGPFEVHAWPDDDREPDGTLIALRLPLPVPVGTRYIRNGWQSWSAPTIERMGGHVVRHPATNLTIGCRHMSASPPYDGDESYDLLVADGFVAGFVEGGGVLVARPRHGDLLAVRERGGPHPPVLTATGYPALLTGELLDLCPGRVPVSTPLGWSTWSVGGPSFALNDTELSSDLAGAAELGRSGLLEAFHVDDGWFSALGDWHRVTARLAGFAGRELSPRGIARRIEDAGLEPGAWIAPFAAAPHSELLDNHPEWILRDFAGCPVPVMSVPWWGGTAWALDTTRADVCDWLSELGATFAAWGFAHLKVDFCYAAALPGRRHKPATGETALRLGLGALRRGTGDDVVITGCGSPLWPAVGLVDAMRVGPDVTDYWGPQARDGVEDASTACLQNCWRSAWLRASLHGRLWANDPDAILLRSTTSLSRSQAHGWARWIAESGQAMCFSDHFSDLTNDDLGVWAELVETRRGIEANAA